MRRTFRDAFDLDLGDRSLTKIAIARARGEDLEDIVKAMITAADRGGPNDDKIIRALGAVFNGSRSVSQSALEFCKRVGFGADPKVLDDATTWKLAEQIVGGMLTEAKARAAQRDVPGAAVDVTVRETKASE